MKLFRKYTAIVVAAMTLAGGSFLTSCDDDDIDTNQYIGGVNLNVYGPSPVARGGELRFLGSGMDQVKSISIPGCDDITDIKRISNEEIRITVPQTAEPGLVTLHTSAGDIVTKTPLLYLEPISFDAVTPTAVKAGDELTITGEYLNLIKEVCFPFVGDSVNVYAADFITHTRNEIKLIVPRKAAPGKLIISDAAEMPNLLYSEDDLDVALPAVASVLSLEGMRPGSEVKTKVTNIDLVDGVEMPNGDLVDFKVNNDELSFILPDNATDGDISMIAACGIRVPVASSTIAVPTEMTVTPAKDLRGGDIITISGKNMDQVVDMLFPNVADAVAPKSVSESAVTVEMPAMAQTGTVTLNLRSGKQVYVEIATAKPENVAYASASVPAGTTLVINGNNLDVVSSVVFAGDVEVAVANPSANTISVEVPFTAQSGALVLNMANGESVEAPVLTIEAPETAYVSGFPEEKLISGNIYTFTVANGDKLTNVTINDQQAQFLLDGDQLQVKIPADVHNSAKLTLISTNGSIDYTLDVTHPDDLERVIWTGPWDNNGWGGNQDLAWGGFDWSTVSAGQTLTVYGTINDGSGWGCISLRHGNGWGNLPDPCPAQFDFNDATTSCSLVLTSEILQDIIDNGGLVMTGDRITITKVTIL